MTNLPIWPTLTNAEKMAIILPAWNDGKSAGEIAWLFSGASRNAIIGVIHRAKLPKRPDDIETGGRTARPKITKPKPIKPSAKSASAFVSRPEPDPVDNSVMHMIQNNRAPLAGTTPVDILALPNRIRVMCRFPVDLDGHLGYCGIPSGDRMYCETHHAVMYRPTEKFRMPKEARR